MSDQLEKVKKDLQEFERLAKPLIEYLNKNHHPHTKIIVDSSHAEIVEGIMAINTSEFISD